MAEATVKSTTLPYAAQADLIRIKSLICYALINRLLDSCLKPNIPLIINYCNCQKRFHRALLRHDDLNFETIFWKSARGLGDKAGSILALGPLFRQIFAVLILGAAPVKTTAAVFFGTAFQKIDGHLLQSAFEHFSPSAEIGQDTEYQRDGVLSFFGFVLHEKASFQKQNGNGTDSNPLLN